MPFFHFVYFLTIFLLYLPFHEYFESVVVLTCPMLLYLSFYNIVSMKARGVNIYIILISRDNNVGYFTHFYCFVFGFLDSLP